MEFFKITPNDYDPYYPFVLGSAPITEKGKTFFLFIEILPVDEDHIIEVQAVCPSRFSKESIEKAYQLITRKSRTEFLLGMEQEEKEAYDALVLRSYGALARLWTDTVTNMPLEEMLNTARHAVQSVVQNIYGILDKDVNIGSTGWDFLDGRRCGLVQN